MPNLRKGNGARSHPKLQPHRLAQNRKKGVLLKPRSALGLDYPFGDVNAEGLSGSRPQLPRLQKDRHRLRRPHLRFEL